MYEGRGRDDLRSWHYGHRDVVYKHFGDEGRMLATLP